MLLAVAAGLAWLFRSSAAGPAEIRRIVLISIDTCRADYFSCYGYPRQTTPHIDALAAGGILFDNAMSPVPMTLPAHSSMLTGTNPPYHGVHNNLGHRLGDSSLTIAEILQEKNIRTGAIVSAFVLNARFGLNQGFDAYIDDLGQSEQDGRHDERPAGDTTALALDWLDEHQSEDFFLFLHYYDPHDPYEPPEPFATAFKDDLYAGEIAYVDDCIGQVVARLKSLGLYDSTLIIVTSDHGEMLGEHGESTHMYFIYQGAIRVPLIVKLPGSDKSRRIDRPVSIVDIVPTLCGLLEITPPQAVHGEDLTDYLLGPGPKDPDERVLYCESLLPTIYGAGPLLGVRSGRWKYIQTSRPELYDLSADPAEANNLLAAQPRRAELLKKHLQAILNEQLRENSESNMAQDEETTQRLAALGYVSAGKVKHTFEFDPTFADPKDFIELHELHSLATHLISDKKLAQARRVCEKIRTEHLDYAENYLNLGKIAEADDRMEDAIANYSKCVELKYDASEAHRRLAIIYFDRGQYNQAAKHWRADLEVRWRDPDTLADLGLTLSRQQKYDQAIACYKEALAQKPDNPVCHSGLVQVYLTENKFAEAIHHLKELLRINPDQSDIYYNMGEAYFRLNRPADAIEHFGKSLQLNPRDYEAHNMLAKVYHKQNVPGKIVTHLTQSVALRPQQPGMLNKLAWLKAAYKEADFHDPEKAVHLASQCCELTGYKTPSFLDTLAVAYAAAGRFAEAIETTENAISLVQPKDQSELLDALKSRLELYKRNHPYFDPA